jgi:hypothetical protein
MKLLRTSIETMALGTDEGEFRHMAYGSMKNWINNHKAEDLQVQVTEIPVKEYTNEPREESGVSQADGSADE